MPSLASPAAAAAIATTNHGHRLQLLSFVVSRHPLWPPDLQLPPFIVTCVCDFCCCHLLPHLLLLPFVTTVIADLQWVFSGNHFTAIAFRRRLASRDHLSSATLDTTTPSQISVVVVTRSSSSSWFIFFLVDGLRSAFHLHRPLCSGHLRRLVTFAFSIDGPNSPRFSGSQPRICRYLQFAALDLPSTIATFRSGHHRLDPVVPRLDLPVPCLDPIAIVSHRYFSTSPTFDASSIVVFFRPSLWLLLTVATFSSVVDDCELLLSFPGNCCRRRSAVSDLAGFSSSLSCQSLVGSVSPIPRQICQSFRSDCQSFKFGRQSLKSGHRSSDLVHVSPSSASLRSRGLFSESCASHRSRVVVASPICHHCCCR
ncbi:uncharacterized protein LOC127809615 [Diospyros lotus]|uniref:uncharacterized protein LOC127809615 n=1 Tax=Diospyros lotus TaxID=55363 RepID=UPI00224E50DB|nr:uncharacterized protein LOC127809615 [Diospyros lotus]